MNHPRVVLTVCVAVVFLCPTRIVQAGVAPVVVDLEETVRRDWAVPPPHVYVLAVGIDQYPEDTFTNLEGSVNDANAIEAVFRSTKFDQFHPDVRTLTNERATKDAIRAALQDFAKSINPEDLFILSFSGQQTRKPGAAGEVFMAPADANLKPNCTGKPGSCIDEQSLISGSLLYSWLTQIRSRRQILILDTGRTEQALPIFEQHWRSEACSVGPQAMKRILLLTNHGFGMEGYFSGQSRGMLSMAVTNALKPAGDQVPLITAVNIQQSVYRQWIKLGLQPQEQIRAELLGGDFAVSGPAEKELPPQEFLLDSGLGPVCYEEALPLSRGFAATKDGGATIAQNAAPKNYALVVATDNYANWSPLKNPILDASAIETDLRQKYGFTVEHLFDPSRQELKQKLDALHSRQFGPNDQLFIFIAGHGDYDATNDIGYLVFKESTAGHDYDSDMNLLELRSRIDTVPVNHILLVMDSCFAGSLDPEIGGPGGRGDTDQIPQISVEEMVKRSADKKTRMFLTSGSKEYVPDGQPGHHSPFAALLINALEKNAGPDQYLSLAKLPQYFQRLTTSARMGNLGHNQSGSEFFFIPQSTGH